MAYVLLKGSVTDVIGTGASSPKAWPSGIEAWLDYDVAPQRRNGVGGYVIDDAGGVHVAGRLDLSVDTATGKITGGGSTDGIWVIAPGLPEGFTVSISIRIPDGQPHNPYSDATARIGVGFNVAESDGSYLIARNVSYPSGGAPQWQGPPGDFRRPAPYVASISGAYAIDPATQGYDQVLTLTGATTFTLPTVTGTTPLSLVLIQDGTGGRTATFTGVKWASAVPPTLSTAAGAIDAVTLIGRPGRPWHGFVSGKDMR